MRIIFKKIEIHNFKSFDDETFEFDQHEGLNLVCGKNNDIPGSKNATGKSALWDALVFSLFGQTKDNIKNSNIANKYVESKEVRVITYFDIEDKHYKVVSGHNKYGGPYCQLVEVVDDDEVDLTKSTMSETRKFLVDEILHCDLSIFLRTILLSSDQNYNFFRLKKWEKKEFIEKLFDISVFGNMYNEIHRNVLDFDKKMVSQQNRLMILNKNSEDYKARLEKHDNDTQSNVKTLNMQLSQLNADRIAITSQNIDSNDAEVSKYEDMISKVTDAMTTLTRTIDSLQSKNNTIELSVHKLQTSKESKQKTIDRHAELLDKLCADCKHVFKDYYSITTYVEEIQQIDSKLTTLKNEKSINMSAIKQHLEKQTLCGTKLAKLNQKVKDLTTAYNKAVQQRRELDTKIHNVETEISKIEKSDNPYTELYENCLIDIKSESDDLSRMSDKYKYLKFAENIVSQDTLRKFIIADLIGLLNNKIKTYLTKFGARYSVTFDSDMNYTFISDGGECEYDNFSSGERARLMIAACFAFRDFMHIRNNFSSNILILDEFIDGAIDSLAIESILDVLKDFSNMWKQNIFVISHRKEIQNDVFNHIIQIVKADNISKITYIE